MQSAAAALRVAILLLLQLAAAVRNRVPDGKTCCCGSLNLIPVFCSSSFKHDLFFMYPLAVLSHYDLDSPIIIHPR